MQIRRHNKIVWGIIFLFFLIFNMQAFLNHYFFRTYAFDYGFHQQALWHFLQFKSGPITLFGQTLDSFFQVHPSFTLVFLSPLAWLLHPVLGSYTLIFIQVIMLLIGAYYTYKFMLLVSKDKMFSLIALLQYFFIWGHFSAIAFEYIDATVAATVAPVFMYCFYKRKYVGALISFMFIVSSRENMPIWLIFISVFLLIDQYLIARKNGKMLKVKPLFFSKEQTWSWVFIALSISYLIFVFTVLIPYFRVEDSGYTYSRFQYSALGNNIPESIAFVFTHPLEAIKLLFVNHLDVQDTGLNGIKLEFWYVFLASGGLLLLRRPQYLLPFIPVIAQKMYSDMYVMWGINVFYSIEIVSLLPLMSYLSISRIKNVKWRKFAAYFVLVSTLSTTVIVMNSRLSRWYNSEKENMLSADFYQTRYNIAEVNKALALIPADAAVSAHHTLVPHLASRSHIYCFPAIANAEYIALLWNSGNTYPLNKDKYKAKAQEFMDSKTWEIVVSNKDILILKKVILPKAQQSKKSTK